MSEKLFLPAPFFLLRSPLWNKEKGEAFLEGIEDAVDMFERDPLFQEAVAIASATTFDALKQGKRNEVAATLFKYGVRMATRATPFGLFSFVGSGRWGKGDSKVDLGRLRRKVRPDMAWIFAYLHKLYQDENLFPSLSIQTNQLIESQGERFVLNYVRVIAREDGAKEEHFSIRSSPLLREILNEAHEPIRAGDLCRKVLIKSPHLDAEKVLSVIYQLSQQQFLLPSILPSLLSNAPFDDLLRSLPENDTLQKIALGIEEYEKLPLNEGVSSFFELKRKMRDVVDTKSLLQVDAVCDGNLSLPENVGKEICEAAEFMWRLSPPRSIGSAIHKYHGRFIDKYGTSRTVPIKELLCQEKGLGYFNLDDGIAGASSSRFKLCLEKWLHREWEEALLEKRNEIILRKELVEELYKQAKETPTPPEEALVSMDVFFKVASSSMKEIEQGDFLVEFVQPSWHGGSGIGRFFYLLDDNTKALAKNYYLEEEALEKESLFFDASLWPLTGGNANVSIHPSFRKHRLDLQDKNKGNLSLDDIYVGATGNRLYLTLKEGGRELVFRAGNFLNALFTPNTFQLMREISLTRFQLFHPFSWGHLDKKANFLPRVRFQKVILSVAQWNLDPSGFTKGNLEEQFNSWANRWALPERAQLVHNDQQLLVDRKNRACLDEILIKIKKGEPLQFLEYLDQSWVESKDGTHICEFILPLLKNPVFKKKQSIVPVSHTFIDFADRTKLPGDEWLFLKVYLGWDKMNRFLCQTLVELAQEGLEFFFIRYADPDPHLRLRFKAGMTGLFEELNQRAGVWMAKGIIRQFSWGPYEREIERYGGIELISDVEMLFCSDSITVLGELLANLTQNIQLHTLSGIRFLKSCGLTIEKMKKLLEKGSESSEQLKGFREHKKDLLEAVDKVLLEEIDPLRVSLFHKADHLSEDKLYDVLSSMLHMHYNRLGCSQQEEGKARLYALHTLYQKEHAQRAQMVGSRS